MTCAASEHRTGAVLSWGKSWESARPIAFDSMQLKDAQKHYPTHEKELLAVVRALKKWRSDLIGHPITVYTDHHTLENFATKRELSRRQARWQELMADYELEFMYIPGEANSVANALSRLPPDEPRPPSSDYKQVNYDTWLNGARVNAIVTISADAQLLREIKDGYKNDAFCMKLSNASLGLNNIHDEV